MPRKRVIAEERERGAMRGLGGVAVLLMGAVALSGCVLPGGEVQPQSVGAPAGVPEEVWETKVRTEQLSGAITGVQPIPGAPPLVASGWSDSFEVPENSDKVELTLRAEGGPQMFEILVTAPSGAEHTLGCGSGPAGGCEASVSIGGVVESGTWDLEARPEYAVETQFTIDVVVTYRELVEKAAKPVGEVPASVGNFHREEGPVTVEQQGGQYVAKQTITLWNAVGGVSLIRTGVSTFNGALEFRGAEPSEYRFSAQLYARAETEQAAREKIATIRIVHAEALDGSTLVLETGAEAPEKNNVGVSIAAALPEALSQAIRGETSNGPVGIQGLRGEEMEIASSNGPATVEDAEASELTVSTSNGPIVLKDVTVSGALVASGSNGPLQLSSVRAGRVKGTTSNGPLTGDAEAGSAELGTSNGAVDFRYTPTRSGGLSVRGSNGPVRLALPENARTGYDLVATTSNGEVSIALEDGTLTEDERARKHFVTNGYDGRGIRVEAVVEGANGPVEIVPAGGVPGA